jgi:CubicO group peptidase (beta-lactamase class C family)
VLWIFGIVATLASVSMAARQAPATAKPFPPAGKWASREPAALGLDKAKLDEAIAFAVANQNPNTRDLAVDIPDSYRNEAPYNTVIGPTQPRAESNGVIIRHGYVAAEWGDTPRADMTFSVTKTFLTTVVGLAFDRGLIKNVDDRVATYMPAGVDLFASPHNGSITWNHLLRQTSDWSGELWGKPDWADRPARGVPAADWPKREMHEPGSFYKYNDTRVNVMALAALYVLKQPLPDVLKTSIMDPIGASSSWHWEGYENSWVTIDGRKVKSVSGGGHFGGGMFINAFDMARFGYLFLNRGQWAGKQLISEKWIGMARTPGTASNSAADPYGFANWFLNTGKKRYPAAPESAVAFVGNGTNIVYVDWDNDLVVVVRWIQNGAAAQFFAKVLGAIGS